MIEPKKRVKKQPDLLPEEVQMMAYLEEFIEFKANKDLDLLDLIIEFAYIHSIDPGELGDLLSKSNDYIKKIEDCCIERGTFRDPEYLKLLNC